VRSPAIIRISPTPISTLAEIGPRESKVGIWKLLVCSRSPTRTGAG
jgi:hypothetical protein